MERTVFREEHQMFRISLRQFLEKEVEPYYDQWEEERLIPRSLWLRMGEQGYLCPTIDEQYGGAGADWLYSVVIAEEMARVGGGLSGFGLHNDIVTPYIVAYGGEQQKQRWLPSCARGETITAIAMSEPGAGSDLARITTTAIRHGDHYVLNGQKTFITNGIQSDLVIVACKTDPKAVPAHRGVSLLVVERGMPGFSRGKKLNKIGLHSQDTAELIFEDVQVPVENLLGEEGMGFKYLMQKLQQERLMCAIGVMIGIEEMLKMTVEYVKTREAFGQPISKFQNTQFKIAEMATELELGRVFVDQLIQEHIAGHDIVTKVSMAKWWTTELAKRVASQCLQLHGGYGYMEEYKIARRYRDTPVAAIYAGSNEIMKTIIAKNMGL